MCLAHSRFTIVRYETALPTSNHHPPGRSAPSSITSEVSLCSLAAGGLHRSPTWDWGLLPLPGIWPPRRPHTTSSPPCLHAPDPLRPHPRVTRPGPPSTGGLPCAPHLLQSAPPQPPPPPVLAICASRARNESQCSVNVCRRLNQGTQETRGEALVGGGEATQTYRRERPACA